MRKSLCLTAAILLSAGGCASANTATWSGAANSSWGTTTNWSGGAGTGGSPANGDSLAFGSATGLGGTTLTDNLMTASTYTLTSISFNSGAAAFTINQGTTGTLASSSGFTLGKATSAVIINNASSNLETINDNIVIGNFDALTINTNSSGGNITLGGQVTGIAFGVTGGGTVTLAGSAGLSNSPNSPNYLLYAGANSTLNISGTLGSTAGSSLYSHRLGILAGGTLEYSGSGTETFSGDVLGSSNNNGSGVALNSTLEMNGTGTLTISGANSYDTTHGYANLSVLKGTFVDSTSYSTGTPGYELGQVPSGGTSTITLGSGSNNATLSIGVTVSGAASPVYSYASSLSVNGTGTNSIILTSAVSPTFTGSVTLASGSTLTLGATSTGTLGFSGVIGGSGGLATASASTGVVLLTGTDTYTGATTINGGVLQLGNGSTSGSVANTSGIAVGTGSTNATLNFNEAGAFSSANSITAGGTGTDTIANLSTSTDTLSGLVSITNTTTLLVLNTTAGGGNLTFTGTLTGGSSGGQINVTGTGTVNIAGAAAFSNDGNNNIIIGSGATLNISGSLSNVGGTVGTYGHNVDDSGLLIYSGSGTQIISGTIDGSATNGVGGGVLSTGTVEANGTGTLEISASGFNSGNSYKYLTVLQGTFLDAATSSTGTNGYELGTGSGATVTLGSGSNNATLNMDVTGTGTYQSAVSINGTGTDLLENTASGNDTFTNTVTVGSTSILTLANTSTGSLIFTGPITGGGGLALSSGTVTLKGGNTYTGNTTITSGVLVIGGSGYLGTGQSYAGNITDNGLLNYNTSTTQTLTGNISGTGSLTTTGPSGSTLYLTGSNSYTGKTIVSAGTYLVLGNGGTTGLLSASSTITNNGTLAFYRSNTVTQGTDFSSSAISGSGAIEQDGSGTLALNSANTYTGGTTLYSGVVQVAGSQTSTSGALGNVSASSDVIDFEGGTLQFTSANTYDYSSRFTVGSIYGVGSAYNIDTNGQNVTFATGLGNSNAAGGAAALNKFGSGTLTLAGADTYTGGTTVNAGVLQGTTTSLEGNIADSTGAAVAFNQSTTGSYTGVISGGGAVTVAGGGAVSFTNANSYTGGTTVNSGTLYLSNSSGSGAGTGSLTVAGGATLGGTGSYGTTASPGAGFSISGTGTLASSRANVLVGISPAAVNTTTGVLTMIASGTSTITNANLTFNLNATQSGALGSNPSGSGTELSVGNTLIGFGTNQGSVQFTLNLENEPAIVGAYTPYVLIAGTLNSGGSGVNGSQYSGLTLGNVLVNSGGVTETLISGNNLQMMFGSSIDQQYYGANSYFVLYQAAGVDDIDVIVVPEPGTWALMLGGLGVLIFWQRRKSQGGR